jgi:hypothetical protein
MEIVVLLPLALITATLIAAGIAMAFAPDESEFAQSPSADV